MEIKPAIHDINYHISFALIGQTIFRPTSELQGLKTTSFPPHFHALQEIGCTIV